MNTHNAYAIIETGGKQYRVKVGQRYTFEKLNAEPGDLVEFDKVMMTADGDNKQIGAPYLDGCKVMGEVLTQGRDKKIIIFKMRRRKTYRRKQGHRQSITQVKITQIQ